MVIPFSLDFFRSNLYTEERNDLSVNYVNPHGGVARDNYRPSGIILMKYSSEAVVITPSSNVVWSFRETYQLRMSLVNYLEIWGNRVISLLFSLIYIYVHQHFFVFMGAYILLLLQTFFFNWNYCH